MKDDGLERGVGVKKSKIFLRYPAEFRLARRLLNAAEFNVPFSKKVKRQNVAKFAF